METVKIASVTFNGIDAVPVEVEIQKNKGLFGKVTIVGLPGNAVKESRDRVRAAIQSSRIPYPRGALVVNLAPADLKKEGPAYDLPMALGFLAVEGILPAGALEGYLVLGELALDGRVKPVPGVLAAAILARRNGLAGIVCARENAREARLVEGIEVRAPGTLVEAAAGFGAQLASSPAPGPPPEPPVPPGGGKPAEGNDPFPAERNGLDYADVIGQETAKAAMVAAAAGGHNLLMIGPPGSGKTMLARRLPTILPPLSPDDSMDVSRIHSFAHRGLERLVTVPPFRAPHHTVSYAGLVGGGSIPRPGELSLAHKGILFLDELPEFARRTLEALRQPLEEGIITIARARGALTMPARITLVASMNPCPCGYRGDRRRPCTCTPRQAALYLKRISGPLLDRLDLQIEVPTLDPALLTHPRRGLDSRTMAEAVLRARAVQRKRNGGGRASLNAHLTPGELRTHCTLSPRAARRLDRYLARFPLSARGYSRILKLARTLADLDATAKIHSRHLERAIMFRVLDHLEDPARNTWNSAAS